MRAALVVLLPAVAALGAFAHRRVGHRTAWLVSTAAVHLILVAGLWRRRPAPTFGGWLMLDHLGLVVLTVVSLLFAAVACYAVGYLEREAPRGDRAFVSCLLAFLAAASLVAVSHHFGLLWVGMEAATLALAPLVYHRHDRRSLEAVWKYLVLSSVGIAIALLGIFFLATAETAGAPYGQPLVLGDLVARAGHLDAAWLEAAFVLLLVGFGTKMGLAPMHTWKPDTYGEAPCVVGGLMAGALTSCAFLGVARITQVTQAASLAGFTRPLLLGFGLVSLIVAAAFVVGQPDLKRVLAYSSVEHMGLLVLGLGLGGVGPYGTVLHVVNNALAKGLLFLVVGNVILAGGTPHAWGARGILGRLPVSGPLLILGLFAVTGSPPFGPFLSEFTILSAAVGAGHPWVALVVVVVLAVVFVAMAGVLLGGGSEPESPAGRQRESGWLVGGPLALAALLILLGVYLPSPLREALVGAGAALGGHAP